MTLTQFEVSDARRQAELARNPRVGVEPLRGVAKPTESISEKVAGHLGVALFYGTIFGISCWNIWRVIAAITK
jgi:hypothetical protein